VYVGAPSLVGLGRWLVCVAGAVLCCVSTSGAALAGVSITCDKSTVYNNETTVCTYVNTEDAGNVRIHNYLEGLTVSPSGLAGPPPVAFTCSWSTPGLKTVQARFGNGWPVTSTTVTCVGPAPTPSPTPTPTPSPTPTPVPTPSPAPTPSPTPDPSRPDFATPFWNAFPALGGEWFGWVLGHVVGIAVIVMLLRWGLVAIAAWRRGRGR